MTNDLLEKIILMVLSGLLVTFLGLLSWLIRDRSRIAELFGGLDTTIKVTNSELSAMGQRMSRMDDSLEKIASGLSEMGVDGAEIRGRVTNLEVRVTRLEDRNTTDRRVRDR